MSRIPSDLTMRHARTGMMVIGGPLEHILNTCQRIFHMAPDRDIYSKDNGLGLDIMARSQTAYNKGVKDRDYEFERMIQQQFNDYTDIQLTGVIVTFNDHIMIVKLEGYWQNTSFSFQTSSDPNRLATEIKPKEVRGDLYQH
ncbi:MAG: hypothetical protein NC489_08365 [Ruminococcus flavefaciens]|nr:hypothetical protein [Ruminococcus flavefaciens]